MNIKKTHRYLNDFHKKSSEASQKEVKSMLKHPLSWEEARKQVMNMKRKKVK